MKPFVAYYRVSTERQGRSGLGIEAQREDVVHFAENEELERLAEFTEVETVKARPLSIEDRSSRRRSRRPSR